MSKTTMALALGICTSFSGIAMADNALTSDQLMKSIQLSVSDYSTNQADMSKSISGLRTTTIGANAQVTIEMNADGMKMTAKYLCVPQASDMACNLLQ